MTGSWNHGLWISLGRMSALELPNNVNRFWSLLRWCFFATKILKLEWFQIVKLDHFSSRFFLGEQFTTFFGRKRNTLWMISLKKSVCFSQHQTVFFLDLPNSEKKRPTKTPPNRLLSQQAAGEWPCEGFSISKKWGHYRTPTPKHCTIIGKLLQNHHTFCMKFDTPPKWGNLMPPAETPQKMRHAWQNPSFLGRIPIRRLITSAPGT